MRKDHAQKAEQGARANTTSCHGSCSEQHAPRQPAVWLIFDVGQCSYRRSTDLHPNHSFGKRGVGMRNSLPIWSESIRRFPNAGEVKEDCGGRTHDDVQRRLRRLKVIESSFRGQKGNSFCAVEGEPTPFKSEIASRVRSPNKALEPTLTVRPLLKY